LSRVNSKKKTVKVLDSGGQGRKDDSNLRLKRREKEEINQLRQDLARGGETTKHKIYRLEKR